MISYTTERFRKTYRRLPEQVREQAREAYRLFRQNPYHPSLRFKQVPPARPIFSARISRDYRVVGVREEDTIIWFWIGSHAEYDKLISRL